MAKFSKGAYVVLAYRLSIAYKELLPTSWPADPTNELNNLWHQAQGVLKAAERIAEYLANDNRAFVKEHFMAVVKGDADPHSRPPRGNHAT